MPSAAGREDFAPYWLAKTIFDDKESSDRVEEFLKTTYWACGAMYIINEKTGSRYEDCADRYSSIAVFLASLWSFGCHYHFVTPEGKRFNEDLLRTMSPPECYKRAVEIGEEAYQKERERLIALSARNYDEPTGHWEQVWVED